MTETTFTPHPARSSQAFRPDGYVALEDYGVLGEGRTVALSALDGGIDWWCVPAIDAPPLFDRLLDPEGGRFSITPTEPFTATRRYRPDSNVLETEFTTATGRARLTESLNSGTAGRLPWCELARRVDGLEGQVTFALDMRLGRRGDTANPYHSKIGEHTVFHVERVLGLFVHDPRISCEWSDEGIVGTIVVGAGERRTVAIVAGRDEPLVVPSIEEIDARIDLSDQEWRDWAARLNCPGLYRDDFIRSALALKLLLYSPSGAIAAAATTSLPERLGGDKNWDYRYAWLRDAGYPAAADGVRRPGHREDVLGAGGGPNLRHDAPGMGVQTPLVLAIAEVDPRLAQPDGVDLIGQGQAVVVVRQTLSIDADPGEPAVVAQRIDQRRAPEARAAREPARQGDRHDAEALDQIAAGEVRVRRTHHLFADQGRRIAAVHRHVGVEPAPDLGRHMGHEVAADLAACVA
ncbi:glycoside hydrolase family 15 protein [Brevundimonas vesicularis]|uniref:glycoside hydrolase family 15 protein n=1 Tax=Brevundimonas vesicularis TaxID=41276 RepID=UPI0034D1D462